MQSHEKFHRYETKEQNKAEMKKYLKKIIANAYLGGKVEHENLNKMVIIPASLKTISVIRLILSKVPVWNYQILGKTTWILYQR